MKRTPDQIERIADLRTRVRYLVADLVRDGDGEADEVEALVREACTKLEEALDAAKGGAKAKRVPE